MPVQAKYHTYVVHCSAFQNNLSRTKISQWYIKRGWKCLFLVLKNKYAVLIELLRFNKVRWVVQYFWAWLYVNVRVGVASTARCCWDEGFEECVIGWSRRQRERENWCRRKYERMSCFKDFEVMELVEPVEVGCERSRSRLFSTELEEV